MRSSSDISESELPADLLVLLSRRTPGSDKSPSELAPESVLRTLVRAGSGGSASELARESDLGFPDLVTGGVSDSVRSLLNLLSMGLSNFSNISKSWLMVGPISNKRLHILSYIFLITYSKTESI